MVRWSGAGGRPSRGGRKPQREMSLGERRESRQGQQAFEVDVAVDPGRVVIRPPRQSGAWGGSTDPSTCGLWVVACRGSAGSQLHQRGRAGVQRLRCVAGTRPCHLPQARAGPRCNVRAALSHPSSSSHHTKHTLLCAPYTGPRQPDRPGPLVSSRRDPDSRSQQVSEGCGLAGCVAADSREPTRLAALPPSPAIRRHQPGPQSAPKFTFWNDVSPREMRNTTTQPRSIWHQTDSKSLPVALRLISRLRARLCCSKHLFLGSAGVLSRFPSESR